MKINLLLVFCISIFYFSKIASKNVYVSPTGNDNGTGTFAKPFLTIQKGLNVTFAGDTLFIRDGGYDIYDKLQVKNSGTQEKWVTIMAFNGEKVTINADFYLDSVPKGREWTKTGAFHIEGVHFVRVKGLTIVDARNAAFMVRGPNTSNIEITYCNTYNSYNSGIGLWYADSLNVNHCEIVLANNQDKRPRNVKIHREGPHEALSIAGSSHFDVSYNHLHHCIKEGIDCKEFSSYGKIHHNYIYDISREGLYADSWFGKLHEVEIFSNIVFDCEWGVAISGEGKNSEMENLKVYNNLLYRNRYAGIVISVLGDDCPRKNIYLYNNTIAFNGMPGHWGGKSGGIDVRSKNISNVFIVNNIVYKNFAYEIGTFAKPGDSAALKNRNIVIENNFLSGDYDKPSPEGFFKQQVYASPGVSVRTGKINFNDPLNGDFTIKEGAEFSGKSSENFVQPAFQWIGADIQSFFGIKNEAGIWKYELLNNK